ncbi:uncharacterized protein LOC120118985 isoform X2 [Hibiscus syriacus]|uniref:uncharacterized protein LOC120118985 isoform X2 n=1 Tax=Hibiscus syriacus TaxID=106335 RepID=UPI00192224C9|nr:uncharacterized protein LOC120118985 isoform X2 [Hibiscus syriacus]
MMISIGSELEPKNESNTMMEMVSNGNGNGSLSQDSKDKFMHSVSNCEDHNFGEGTLNGVGEGTIPKGTEDMEINITECTNSDMNSLANAECQDTTENSSSFGGTVSGAENDSAISDVEVDSALCSENPLGSMFDGLFLLRKRKLTDHWRRFIRPIMWRCKWLELQLKEFRSQTLKYDQQLAEYDQRKKFEYEKLTFEGLNVKSQPFQIQRKKIMSRRKRKRVEDTADLASYMSNHNLFSYYDSKKFVVATSAHVGDNGNKTVNSNEDIVISDGLSGLEFRDSDIWLENILGKIDLIQSQVHTLKTRVDSVVNGSPQKFSSINVLSSVMPCNTLSGSRSRSSPAGSGERIPVTSQGGNMGDLFMPGSSAVSNHGEVAPFPDVIEGTAQNLAAVSYDNTEDEILIHNQAAKEELYNFQSGLTKPTEELPPPTKKPTVVAPGDDLLANPSVQPDVKVSLTSESEINNNRRNMEKRESGTEDPPMPTEKPTVLAPGDDLLANPSAQPDVKLSLTSESVISNNRRNMEKRKSGTEDPPMPTEKPAVLAPGDDLSANPSVQPDEKVSLTSESKIPNNKSKMGKRKSVTNEPLMPTEKPTVIALGDDLPANPSVQPDVKVPSMSGSKIPKNKRKMGRRKSGTEEPLMPTEKPTLLAPGHDLPANPSVQPDMKLSSLSKSKVPNNKRKWRKQKSGTKKPPMPTKKPTVLAPVDDLTANPSVQPDADVSSSSKVPDYKRKRGKRKSGTGWWSRKSSG